MAATVADGGTKIMKDASSQTENEEVYENGQIINQRWIITRAIGGGSNGYIFATRDLSDFQVEYALKVQRLESRSQIMENEINFYQLAKDVSARRHILPLHDFGFHKNGAIYFVAPLLGLSLDKIVGNAPEKKLSVCISLRLATQALMAIAEVHHLGYVHRNIKPSNFAMGLGENLERLYVIDFGRVRSWMENSSGGLSRNCRYSGALWFTSLRGHAQQILTRRDDLQSWLYVLSYMANGRLPWFDNMDKHSVAEMKCKAEENPKILYQSFPPQIWTIRDYILNLGDDIQPDYASIIELIDQAVNSVCATDCKNDHYPFSTYPCAKHV